MTKKAMSAALTIVITIVVLIVVALAIITMTSGSVADFGIKSKSQLQSSACQICIQSNCIGKDAGDAADDCTEPCDGTTPSCP